MVFDQALTSFDGGRGLDQIKSAIEDFEVFCNYKRQFILKGIETRQSDRML